MRVAITGGAGHVGRRLRREMVGRVSHLRIVDITDPGPLADNEEWVRANVTDLSKLADAFDGMGGIVHLAGHREEGPIIDIVNVNVIGTYNVYEAARQAGVDRVVYGSSNHISGFYPRTQRITPDDPMKPDTRYGLSKCWGELAAGLFFEKHGIRTLSIRIGNFADVPHDDRARAIWISPRDLAQLVFIGLDHPAVEATTVWGVSSSNAGWWDNAVAERLGYAPLDRSPKAPDNSDAGVKDDALSIVEGFFQGGGFCAIEHDGFLRHEGMAKNAANSA